MGTVYDFVSDWMFDRMGLGADPLAEPTGQKSSVFGGYGSGVVRVPC
jgi:hypothetical protein